MPDVSDIGAELNMVKLNSFSEMKRLNGAESFSAVDYLYYAGRRFTPADDFTSCLLDVMEPDLILVETAVLVKAVGALERYRRYRSEGMEAGQAQYWSNLIETTELFGPITIEIGRRMAHFIANLWRSALSAQYIDLGHEVRVIEDSAEGEIFVGLSTVWPSSNA